MVMAWPVPMDPAFRRILLETAETLAFALAGGLMFIFLGLPAGLVSGSVLAVASAAVLGRPMRLPLPLARVCYVVVGTLLGTVVTPETLRGVATWPASILLLMLASLGMIAATMTYLRVVHRWDPLSALMGAPPRFDGPSNRAIERTRWRSARRRHRADRARSAAGCRPAERARAVRTGRASGAGTP